MHPMQVNAHYDTLLTEDVSHWDHLLSNQLILAMECLATKTGKKHGYWNANICIRWRRTGSTLLRQHTY